LKVCCENFHQEHVTSLRLNVFSIDSFLYVMAPTSFASIFGRVTADLDDADIYSRFLIIIAHSLPLHRGVMHTILVESTTSIASVSECVIEGVFDDKIIWRWYFWMYNTSSLPSQKRTWRVNTQHNKYTHWHTTEENDINRRKTSTSY
jgi:hypothetical protein